MKGHKVMLYALVSTGAAFLSGFLLGRLFLKGNNVFEIFIVVAMIAAAVFNGWIARRDFKKLISYIPGAS
jgi:hypothetical protein